MNLFSEHGAPFGLCGLLAQDRTTVGQVVEIGNLPGLWRRIPERYRYDIDKSRCPKCRGLGHVWAGWFTCEDGCGSVALVDTGEAFEQMNDAVD